MKRAYKGLIMTVLNEVDKETEMEGKVAPQMHDIGPNV